MIVIDNRGEVKSFSLTAERMFGYSAGEVLGRNVSVLMPSPHRESHDSYIKRYLQTGKRRVIGKSRVVSGERKDGSTFPIELALGEVRQGKARLFTGFIRDLTERQRTEKRLQELQSELAHVSRLSEMGQMASGLAHELNQPLAAISNYLGTAQALVHAGQIERSDEIALCIDRAIAQTERTAQVIRRLRDFVRKEIEPAKQLVDVGKMIEEASALALIGAKELGIQVHLNVAPRLPPIGVDKIQIQQVVVNLMRNAVEAMERSKQKTLIVDAGRDGRFGIVIRVIDTGAGLASEVKKHLFEPFVTTKPDGMGIGLTICRTIIDGHGGKLWAQENPAGGTIFNLSIPI